MHRRTLIAAALATPSILHAQAAWRPDRPMRLILPVAPGGLLDVTARVLTREMEVTLGQPIVIDYRSGAGGNIGAEATARAAPDGLTFMLTTPGPMVINQFLFPTLPYDPETAFAPITLATINPVVILAAPLRPERTLTDIIATVRSGQPVNYGSGGSGSTGHMAMEVLKSRLSLSGPEHVPFRGAGPSLQALAGNQIEFAVEGIASAIVSLSAGTARPVAVTTARRWPGLPDVPTVEEAGVADFNYASWTCFVHPAGVPAAAVAQVAAAANEALAKPAIRARLLELGGDPVGGSPDDLARFLTTQRAFWRDAVRISGARAG